MLQVALIPPPEALGPAELFRRLHDPGFHRLPAHVTLLPPFEPVRRDVLERFDAFDAAPFRARLGAPFETGTTLWLAFVEGGDAVAALRRALADALLDPLAPPAAAPAALRIGHFSSAAELELARRGLAADLALPEFRVDTLTLLLEDRRGLWHDVRLRALR